MITKIKLTWLEVVLMIVLVLGILTAVQGLSSTLAFGEGYLPDVAGEACSSACTG